MLKRFLKDRRGNIAMMFGLVSIPLIAATGAAIDYSHAYEQRQVVQDALDAAALAANKLIGLSTDAEIFAEAQAFFVANTDDQINSNVTLHMQIDGGSVRLWTTLDVPTYFLGIVGIDDINFDISSTSIAGAATYEVVLVLDNSTSMRGSKISTLKTAAADLVNSLFALAVSNPADDPVRVGLVPFGASVNVGAGYANASWMDTTGIAADTGLNFTTDTEQAAWWAANYPGVTMPANVFGAFTNSGSLGLSGYTWGGCVEARAYPYDVTDETPTPPCRQRSSRRCSRRTSRVRPDSPNSGFHNSYLSDTGGTCVKQLHDDLDRPGHAALVLRLLAVAVGLRDDDHHDPHHQFERPAAAGAHVQIQWRDAIQQLSWDGRGSEPQLHRQRADADDQFTDVPHLGDQRYERASEPGRLYRHRARRDVGLEPIVVQRARSPKVATMATQATTRS